MKSGATAGRLAATVVSRMERRTKTGNKMGIFGLSDPSGHYEAIMFAEGLQAVPRHPRARLAGAAVSVRGGAGRRGARAHPVGRSARQGRGQAAEGAARVPARPGADRAGRRRLEGKGDGEVNVVLQLGGGTEVEIKLPGRFKVSPQIAGAIKAVPGVLDVRLM